MTDTKEKIKYEKPEVKDIWEEDIGAMGIYLLEM